jgi:AAA+ superfamily predicted ATPase
MVFRRIDIHRLPGSPLSSLTPLERDMQEHAPRSLPVIVITGTPGTGKTTHAQLLVEQSPIPLQHVNVSELVKEKMLHDGFDEEWQTYVVDEDKVCLHTV